MNFAQEGVCLPGIIAESLWKGGLGGNLSSERSPPRGIKLWRQAVRLVLATSNRGKVREIRGMLMGLGVEVLALDDFKSVELPHETGATFAENALVKARAVAAATGIAALADDSGLEVDCLGGRPGVFSARYAGEGASDRDNYIKLLGELEGVPFEKRSARFRCAVAFVEPGDGGRGAGGAGGAGGRGVEMVFEGSLEGFIATEPRGEGGFGYDPVFFLPERNRTVAELPAEEKNAISHRARALEGLRKWLEGRV